MKMVPSDKHILYQSASDIRDICAPLERHLNIREFTYEKIYNNNLKVKLTNQPEWISFFYEHGFYLIGDDTIDALRHGVNLTTNLQAMNQDDQIFKSCMDHFYIGEGLLLIDFYDDYRELYWFTSSLGEKVIDIYNNVDLLKIFIKHFKQQASKILARAESEKILRPHRPEFSRVANTINEKEFLKEISVKKYVFSDHSKEIVFTKKELECAVRLIKGETAKEIAANLCRSNRTIESHLENIKVKMGCNSKSTLVSSLIDLGVSLYVDKPF